MVVRVRIVAIGRRRHAWALPTVVMAVLAALVGVGGRAQGAPQPIRAVLTGAGAKGDINKIKHVIIIMQENRSFDDTSACTRAPTASPSTRNGKPTVCVNDPKTGTCVDPWHDPTDINYGGPHGDDARDADIDGGKMDGFIARYETACRMRSATGRSRCGVTEAACPT